MGSAAARKEPTGSATTVTTVTGEGGGEARVRTPRAADERFKAWGVSGSTLFDLTDDPPAERTVSADVFEEGLRSKPVTSADEVRIIGIEVDEPIDLRWLQLETSLVLVGCRFDDLIADDSSLRELRLIGTSAKRLRLNNATLRAGLHLDRSTCVLHADRLTSGEVVLDEVTFDPESEELSVALRSARVDGPVEFRGHCRSAGSFAFGDARIAGSLIVGDVAVDPPAGAPAIHMTNARVEGDVRMTGATLAGTFDQSRAVIGNRLLMSDTKITAREHALVLDGAEIGQDASIAGCTITGQVRLLDCRVGGQLNSRGSVFVATTGTAISATRVRVGSGLALVESTTVKGEFRCDRAVINGGMALPGAKLVNPNGDALVLDQSEVNGSLHLIDGFEAEGTVVMIGGVVTGQLSLRSAHVRHAAGDGAVVLDGIEVRGSLLASAGLIVEGGFFLRGAAVGFGAPSGASSTTQSIELRRCRVDGVLDMARTKVFGHCDFTDAELRGDVHLLRCEFRDAVTFNQTRFGGALKLRGATFDGPSDLRLALPNQALDLQQVRVMRPLRVVVNARSVELQGASLEAETSVEVAGEVNAESLRVRAPSRIRRAPGAGQPLRLVSLQDASMDAVLTIGGDVDATHCKFRGAQNLDRVVVGSTEIFASTRSGRRALHEELQLRAGAAGTTARDLASVYRGLRKGLEDSKDEPGAADFYYGEMEMRRLGPARASERWLITLYWLVSGYGLRAWRAFASAVVVLLVASSAMFAWGFDTTSEAAVTETQRLDPTTRDPVGRPQLTQTTSPDEPSPSLIDATFFTLQSALPFAPTPADQSLTRAGLMIRLAARVITPILIGLGALALRSRIKR